MHILRFNESVRLYPMKKVWLTYDAFQFNSNGWLSNEDKQSKVDQVNQELKKLNFSDQVQDVKSGTCKLWNSSMGGKYMPGYYITMVVYFKEEEYQKFRDMPNGSHPSRPCIPYDMYRAIDWVEPTSRVNHS